MTVAETETGRRVTRVEEVTEDDAAALYEDREDGAEPTGRLARGNSDVIASLADPGETYADVREAISSRTAATPDP